MPPRDVFDPVAALPWHGQAVLPALVPAACLSRALLLRFQKAMQAQGLPVQVQRMRYDRIYALQTLCEAHGHGDAPLRALAMQLFECFHPAPHG